MRRNNPPLLNDWGHPEPNALTQALRERRAAGLTVNDFITCRPHDYGFQFNAGLLEHIMARAAASAAADGYRAEAAGSWLAREAVADAFGPGAALHRILLTPGTSMAYYYLFRLLARSHGDVLCPVPTYPLFDDLAKLAGLAVRRYHLHRQVAADGTTRWTLNPDELRFQLTPHTCAIVLVNPHNPTGTVMTPDELAMVHDIAAGAGVPVIVDEVFRGYELAGSVPPPRFQPPDENLWITLNGLSKSHFLPGLKAGWMVVQGKENAADELMHAADYISDCFLPVSDIIQRALPDLLGADALREARRLTALQRSAMQTRLTAQAATRLQPDHPQAGPYLCIPLPESSDPEAESIRLLRDEGALFHPGSLYAMPDPCLIATAYNPAAWPA